MSVLSLTIVLNQHSVKYIVIRFANIKGGTVSPSKKCTMGQYRHIRLKFLLEIKEMTIHTQKTSNQASVFLGLNKDVETPSKETVDADFNFDLERMKKAVNAKSYTVPQTNSFEEFDAWMNQV